MSHYLDGPSDRPIGVGVSGGGDSVALLCLLVHWGKRPIEVFCVDHGLNPLSQDWTTSVQKLCHALGVGFTPLVWDEVKPKTGLQAKARHARHSLMAKAARQMDVRVICLGHTADDALEASAMRLKGANVSSPKVWGPSPIWPEGRDQFYLRPLMGLRRQVLRDWLKCCDIPYIDDPANENSTILRARVRQDLKYAEDNILIAPEPLRFEDLEAMIKIEGSALYIDKLPFFNLSPPKAQKLLASAMVCVGGSDRLPKRQAIDTIIKGIKTRSLHITTLCGAKLEVFDTHILIARESGDLLRRGQPQMALKTYETKVWDGRYEMASGAEPVLVHSLFGHLSKLSKSDQRKIRDIDLHLRGSLPILNVKGTYVLPKPPLLVARPLLRGRLYAALGQILSEADISQYENLPSIE
jgi:tRNA(Ile)-lysidine synthase